MALQQFIFRFDEHYITRFESILEEKDLVCFSCGREFKRGDLIYSKRRSTGGKGQDQVKRHLKCAILKNVLTEREARKMMPRYYFSAIAGAHLIITALSVVL